MEKLDALCADACIGSLISLTSKSEIRYEGELFTLDTEKSTIVLKDVRSFGTEGRGINNLPIPSSNTVYEYIIFRNKDIKDLHVVAFSGVSKKPSEAVQEVIGISDKVHEHLNDCSLNVCFGWPLSPQSSQIQAGQDCWQWPCPIVTSGSYGISPNFFLTTLPTFGNQIATTCSWSPFMQAKYDTPGMNFKAKLSTSYYVPNVGTMTQTSALSHDSSASKQEFGKIHESFESNTSIQNDNQLFGTLKACPLWQQPLLPLPQPASEIKQKMLIKESEIFTHHHHARKPSFCSRGRPQMSVNSKEFTTKTIHEVSQTLNPGISKDFDFEAMNKQFNKKELWDEIELHKIESTNPNGNQHGLSQNFLKSSPCGILEKVQFVDDFFDLSLSEEGSLKEKRVKGSTGGRQHQVDAQTFGMSSIRKKKGSRHRSRKKSSCGGQSISIQTK